MCVLKLLSALLSDTCFSEINYFKWWHLNGNYVHYAEKTFMCFYIVHTISFIRKDKKSEAGVAFPVLPEAAFAG